MWSAELQNNSLETPQVSQSCRLAILSITWLRWIQPIHCESRTAVPLVHRHLILAFFSATAVERCRTFPWRTATKTKSAPGRRSGMSLLIRVLIYARNRMRRVCPSCTCLCQLWSHKCAFWRIVHIHNHRRRLKWFRSSSSMDDSTVFFHFHCC